jgi:8-oxo-dGTP diphosphatase
MADPHRPREGGADRAVVEVAVGILIRADGSFLLTSRPPGKVYAAYWEFPGGKLEAGELVLDALGRELHEELGIGVTAAALWRTEMVDYPHALVRLNFCKVTAWTGTLAMREGQQCSWQQLPVRVAPVLAGTVPVLALLAQDGITGWRAKARLWWYLLGTPGVLRQVALPWASYFRPGFHPWDHDDRALIAAHEAAMAPVPA